MGSNDVVAFQDAFSRQKLQAIYKKHCHAKELKAGMVAMRKRLLKHLCPSENLNAVVWGRVMHIFHEMLTKYDSIIKECYPGMR